MGEPLLCRLGFHKWQKYGRQVEVFWHEPRDGIRYGVRYGGRYYGYLKHSETVYERQKCKRCGAKIRRKLVTNSDGTLSCVGWEPNNEETDKD